MQVLRNSVLFAAMAAAALTLGACEKPGTAEQAGKEIDKATQGAVEQSKEMADKAAGAAESAGQKLDQAAEQAGQKVEQATAQAGQATGEAMEKAGEKLKEMGAAVKEKTEAKPENK